MRGAALLSPRGRSAAPRAADLGIHGAGGEGRCTASSTALLPPRRSTPAPPLAPLCKKPVRAAPVRALGAFFVTGLGVCYSGVHAVATDDRTRDQAGACRQDTGRVFSTRTPLLQRMHSKSHPEKCVSQTRAKEHRPGGQTTDQTQRLRRQSGPPMLVLEHGVPAERVLATDLWPTWWQPRLDQEHPEQFLWEKRGTDLHFPLGFA